MVDYLISLDFDRKSYTSPDKLLDKIPHNLKYCFYRGVVDGDGCFYIGDNNYMFNITSSFNQNWKYVKSIFKELDIKYNVVEKEHKNKNGNISLSSVIYICNVKDILKFGDYIYEDFENNSIGLYRKYLKYKHMDKR